MIEPNPAPPAPPTPGHTHRPPWFRTLWALPLFACALLWILLSARKIESYDLGTHLKAGSWILQNRAFPSKDTFTYTQNDRDYLDSNGLYQVLLYLLQSHFGYGVLTFLNVVVLLLVFGLLGWRLWLSGASPPEACACLLAATFLMERRFIVRPEVFSWFFLALTLLILDYRERGRNYLRWLPLIQFFWVNTEGLFVLGWVALLAYGLNGFFRKRPDKELLKFGFLSFVADLLNPYFLKGAVFPFLLWTRLQGSNLHKENVTELYSPWRFLTADRLHYDSYLYIFLFLFLFPACLLGLFLSRKKLQSHQILLPLAFGILGLNAIRNIPLFALVSIPIFPGLVPPGAREWTRELSHRKWLAIAIFCFFILFSARVSTNAYYISDRRVERLGWGLGNETLPLDAVQFLKDNHLDGRILNSLDCGGWVDWQAPQPSFIDGRSEVVGENFYGDYTHSFEPGGLLPLLIRYQPQLVLLDYKAASPWIGQLEANPSWRLIYLDPCSAIYAHEGYAPQFLPFNLESLLSLHNVPYVGEDEMSVRLSQFRFQPTWDWFQGFYNPIYYPGDMVSLGLFSLKYGQYLLARALFFEALRTSTIPYEEVYLNLGIANLNLGKFELGKLCLQDTLRINPSNSSAQRMASHILN